MYSYQQLFLASVLCTFDFLLVGSWAAHLLQKLVKWLHYDRFIAAPVLSWSAGACGAAQHGNSPSSPFCCQSLGGGVSAGFWGCRAHSDSDWERQPPGYTWMPRYCLANGLRVAFFVPSHLEEQHVTKVPTKPVAVKIPVRRAPVFSSACQGDNFIPSTPLLMLCHGANLRLDKFGFLGARIWKFEWKGKTEIDVKHFLFCTPRQGCITAITHLSPFQPFIWLMVTGSREPVQGSRGQ